MKGIIYHTNTHRGMYSVQLPDGSFSVFELVDPMELNMYSEIIGEFEQYGDKEAQINQSETLHIHIDHYGLNEMAAFQKTFLRE